MENIYFTVGPTQVHPETEAYVHDALAAGVCSLSHRGKAFAELFARTSASVKKLLNVPDGFHVFFLGSATEAIERVVENCVGERSFHLVNGAFSARFFETAQELKKQPEKVEVAKGQGFDFASLAPPAEAEVVCITQNETSTPI